MYDVYVQRLKLAWAWLSEERPWNDATFFWMLLQGLFTYTIGA